MKKSKDPEWKKLPVTKLDAARRQLETGITLWFHEMGPVSIHTLTGAAYKLLYDINTKAVGPSASASRMTTFSFGRINTSNQKYEDGPSTLQRFRGCFWVEND